MYANLRMKRNYKLKLNVLIRSNVYLADVMDITQVERAGMEGKNSVNRAKTTMIVQMVMILDVQTIFAKNDVAEVIIIVIKPIIIVPLPIITVNQKDR